MGTSKNFCNGIVHLSISERGSLEKNMLLPEWVKKHFYVVGEGEGQVYLKCVHA